MFAMPMSLPMDDEPKAWTPWGEQPLLPRAANDNLPLVVALSGAAGSGKSTAASYLVERHGYTRIRFAGPLKAMMRALKLDDAAIEGAMKEAPLDVLSGHTPRYAMQTLGTEWGRKCMGEDFWVNLWRWDAEVAIDKGGRVVVDDCRFPNEAAMVRRMGGDIYRIGGRGGIAGDHESERQDFMADVHLDNAGTVEELHTMLDEALGRWC